jgi:hypothetical protein
MQQTEQMARRHDVWHYALWSMIQQSEILFARASCRPPGKFRKSVPADSRTASGTAADA